MLLLLLLVVVLLAMVIALGEHVESARYVLGVVQLAVVVPVKLIQRLVYDGCKNESNSAVNNVVNNEHRSQRQRGQ